MSRDNKIHEVKKVLAKIVQELSSDLVDEDVNLSEILDSFSLIELMVKLEEKFKITLSAEEFSSENFSSYHKLALLILHKNDRT